MFHAKNRSQWSPLDKEIKTQRAKKEQLCALCENLCGLCVKWIFRNLLKRRMCLKIFPVIILLFAGLNSFAHEPTGASTFRFIENKNQWDQKVKFRADIQSGALFLEKNCFTYHLIDGRFLQLLHANKTPIDYDTLKIRGHVFKVNFENANADVVMNGEGEHSDYYNYFLGNDPSRWASKAKAYNIVNYQNLYDGIDLKIYSQGTHLKYDFIILPNVDPSLIQIKYEGIDRIFLREGNLVLKTSLGDIAEQKPFAYQFIDGKLIPVSCNYVLNGSKLSYAFPSGYNKKYKLIIDPVLIFSTYSGSTVDNFGYTATPDSHGFLYSGSTAFGIGYPVTSGAYQTTFGGGYKPYYLEGTDIAITKYDTSGTKRIYSTYLGGKSDDVPHSLIVNSKDELFIFGTTGSSNFPVSATAYDNTFAGGTPIGLPGIAVAYESGSDIIISKLSTDGSSLIASTYLGGTSNDGLLARSPASNLRYNYADEVRGEIEIDKSDNVYIATCTRSPDFPMVESSFQEVYNGGNFDALIVKMDNDLETILWSSFLGGSLDDAAYSIELDSLDNLYVTGGTTSANFFTSPGVLYSTNQGGRSDGFITYIDKNGDSIIYSTYYGSSAYDQIYFISLDRFNNVHVFGQTEATGVNANRYIQNAVFSQPNSGQFISKINPELNSVIWSTVFGTGSGRPNISPTAFMVDLCSKIYLSGWGGSPENNDFLNGINRPFNMLTTLGPNPATDYYDPTTLGHDFYLFVLEDDASAVHYASFFGGDASREHVDGGTSRFDRKGKIYQAMCAGCGENSDMPLKPILGSAELPSLNNSDNCNIGVFKMDFRLPIVVADFEASPGCIGDTIEFINKSLVKSATTYQWDFGDGATSTDKDPVHVYATGGTYNVMLILEDLATCNLADTIVKSVYISDINNLTLTATADQYTIFKGKSTTLHANPNSGYGFSWSPSGSLSNAASPNPIATPDTTTTYTLALSDPIVSRCRITDTVTINVIEILCEEPDIFIPNAFTPDGDGKNDLLFVRSNNIMEMFFTIYNRWGEKVFVTKDQNEGWDGTYKGMKADPGVFVYYLEVTCVDDQKFFKKGNITLIR
jgi:gliding motility-associated-like protein